MNILFYTNFQPRPNCGGTEQATLSVANALSTLYGHCCSYIYGVSAAEVCRRIETEKIDIVIVQSVFKIAADLRALLGKDSAVRIIMVHHFAPGWELSLCTLKNYRNLLKTSDDWKHGLWYALKIILFPIFKRRDMHRLHRLYADAYQAADLTVLLTERYKEKFMEFGSIIDDKKFRYIPNMLTLPRNIDADSIKEKKKEVLIVARLEEASKHLTAALDIWKEVKQHSAADGWTLHIVGDGPDNNLYKKKVQRENITDITFHGRQNPIEYYHRASLFMMTSRSEAWPLTLSECQQMGVVPIAYDTFEALAEIIQDEYNGRIIADGDIKGYATALADLISNKKKRQQMAQNALLSYQRYAIDKVAEQWNAVLDSTLL